MRKLRPLAPAFAGATAEIAGGADVLKLLPRSMHEEAALERAGIIDAALGRHGIQVTATDLGGSSGRTIYLKMAQAASPTELLSVAVPGAPEPVPLASLTPRTSFTPSQLKNARVLHVNAGDLVIDAAPTQFVAVLGSCVGVALWDTANRIGGMVHVMIPCAKDDHANPARYADLAVDLLVNELGKAGAKTKRLVAAVGGGASVLNIGRTIYDFKIGRGNADNVNKALARLGIPIKHSQTGGSKGCKMWVNLRNFSVRIKKLPSYDSERSGGPARLNG